MTQGPLSLDLGSHCIVSCHTDGKSWEYCDTLTVCHVMSLLFIPPKHYSSLPSGVTTHKTALITVVPIIFPCLSSPICHGSDPSWVVNSQHRHNSDIPHPITSHRVRLSVWQFPLNFEVLWTTRNGRQAAIIISVFLVLSSTLSLIFLVELRIFLVNPAWVIAWGV